MCIDQSRWGCNRFFFRCAAELLQFSSEHEATKQQRRRPGPCPSGQSFSGGWGGIFCAVLLTAWKVALQLGVAQILLNLSKMAVGGVTHWRAMLVNCIVTEQPCMARKGKLLPISTRNPCKISTVRSRCCLRSFSDLTQELLCVLGTWLTFQLVGGLTDFTNWVPFIADFFFPKSKEQGATREFSS